MDSLFEGLLQYEIMLLILGVIFFLLLLFLLVYMIIKERKFGSMLGFFVIPIVMIGFPGIKKIQFKDWMIELREEMAQTTDSTPAPGRQDQIEEILGKINPERISSYDNSLLVAEAYTFVGDSLKAFQSAEKALEAEPSSQQATELKTRLSDSPRVRVEMKIREVQQNPSDQNVRMELNKSLREIAPSSSPEIPADYVLMARAKKALGEEEAAEKYIDSALVIDPGYGNARKLNRTLER
jgi:tetratricopeptide (TPR) repeat protein